MALTNKTAIGVITGLVGLILNFTSPNFEFKDFKEPTNVIKKMKYNDNYWGGGLVYGLSYAMIVGSVIGLGYNALTGNFIKKK